MKLGKKLLSLLTVLCLTLSLFPTMALADDGEESTGSPATSVSVGSTTLSVGDYLTSNGTVTTTEPNEGTGYIHFSSNGTLELNGYTDENTNTEHQISGANLTIHLTGDNHINSANNGIYSAGTLTISGPGSLTLTAAINTTIYAKDTITIQGGAKVTAACGRDGQSIHLDNDDKKIIITGSNTKVDASDSTNGKGEIRCGYSASKYTTCTGEIQLNDGAKLTASKINGTLKINGQTNSSTQIDEVTALPTTYTVSGTVTDSSSTPIAGASVQLCTTGTADTSTVINTSNDGTYRFTGISNGNYTITVSKDGYTADSTELSKTITVNGQNVTRDFSITPISYYISVNGIAVNGANKDNVLNDATATVKYTPADEETAQKLTLNGANISASETTKGIESTSGALDIELIGENKIETDSNSINSSGALTITSTKNGSLTMSSKNNMSTLYATADITISGSAIVNATINGGAQAIHSNPSSGTGSITITGNAKVTAKNTRTLGQTSDVTKAHSVALLTGTYDAATPSGTITVSGSASLLAQGSTQALKCGTFTTDGLTTEVSKNYTGVNPETYNSSSPANYKYVHVHPASDIVSYDVWVGDTLVTSQNKNNVLNDGKVTYAPDTQTLTLTDATITGAPNRQYTSMIKDACGIYAKHDLTIKLSGRNTVKGSENADEQKYGNYGIFVSGRLTFTSASDSVGSITASGGKSNNSGNAWVPGVYASGITVKNCNVTTIGGTASDSYPVAYAMSKAPTLVGAEVVETNTKNSAEGASTKYNESSIRQYKYLKITKKENDTSVAAPVIAPEGGYFTSDPHVTISCPTDGATIYYTTDGTTPTASSTNYTNTPQITLSTTGKTTIKAIAVKGNNKKSDVVTAEFTQRAAGEEVTKVALDVAVDTHNMTTKVGNTEKLTATVQYKEETTSGVTVTWESDNPEVATVVDGVITAKSVGKARVTAAVVENGVTYSDFCDVIVEARPSSSHHSSSSTTYYDVNAVVSGEGGSVAAGTKRASRGTTVTVTATAASGYQVAQVSAVDKDGKTVSLTDKGDGVYTFVMPASKVDVTARFAQVQKPEEKDPYGDVSKDSYYYDAVKWAAETGVTTGVGDGLFAPEWVCTRGQIVTFLWRASGSPAPKATELPFTDVAADAYYAQAVLWAVEKGITNGTSETTFGPDQTCTRAHAVAFLYRMSGSPAAAGSTFSDVAADAYYSTAVAWAVEKGITNGTSGTTFSPDDTCTRGQIVTFLYRLAQTK